MNVKMTPKGLAVDTADINKKEKKKTRAVVLTAARNEIHRRLLLVFRESLQFSSIHLFLSLDSCYMYCLLSQVKNTSYPLGMLAAYRFLRDHCVTTFVETG